MRKLELLALTRFNKFKQLVSLFVNKKKEMKYMVNKLVSECKIICGFIEK